MLHGTRAFAGAAATVDYTVRPDAALSRLDVEACASAGVHVLAPVEPAGIALLATATTLDGAPLRPRDGGVPIPPAGGCLQYTLDLRRVVPDLGAGLAGAQTHRTGSDLMLSPALWLWRPPDGAPRLRVRFELPQGMAVSVPWPRGDDGVHVVSSTPADWASTTAFGGFENVPITLGDARLHVAVMAGQPRADVVAVRDWVSRAARAVRGVAGRFPVPDVQVLVVPVGAGDEPVPFAQVLRGGGTALRFFIDQRRPAAEFQADWTATHEFSHLLHPFLRAGDAWAAEGLASYYQNVLRARDGTLTAREAWQRLENGFARGRAQTDGRPLARVAAQMHRDQRYMRVYWSGAAIALLADVELRAGSGGAQSLDTVLAGFGACCLPAQREWTAAELFANLDALAGTPVFVPLLRRWAGAGDFPDVAPAYTRLGISPGPEGIVLDDDAPLADARRRIMCGAADCPAPR